MLHACAVKVANMSLNACAHYLV